MVQDRYQRGWEKLKEIDGEAGEKVIQKPERHFTGLGKICNRIFFRRCLFKREAYFEI
jgi:hypothetical protein